MKPFAYLSKHQDTITNYMYLGLLPFFAGALSPWVFIDYEAIAVNLFFIYSAIIFSFLSGVIWATVLLKNTEQINEEKTNGEHNKRHLHAAIIFSLFPLAAALLPDTFKIGLMLLGFLLLLFWEKLFLNSLYAQWYQQLRHKITFIVVACHMLTLLNIIQN